MPLIELNVLYKTVAEQVAPLEKLHASRLKCRKGCNECCVDDLTVFDVEAENIRQKYRQLLAEGAPHPAGKCAFLDEAGACRIYDTRPYVCRTQGLPLRWIDEDANAEMRDICPLNAEGAPVESLPADECWTIGPMEAKLSELQGKKDDGKPRRISLRELFRKGPAASWVLLRLDDNGNEFEIRRFADELDAEIQKQEMETIDHKQTYLLRYEGGE